MRKRLLLQFATVAVALGGLAAVRMVGGSPARERAAPPNVLLIISDDQAWSTFSPTLMPAVYREIVRKGALFHRAYVNTPLCCPSRAQILTGLYAHHSGVFNNHDPLTRPTLVEALHDRGYRTIVAGKYLNSHPCDRPRPEFDEWFCVGDPQFRPSGGYQLRDPIIHVNGRWETFTGRYQTDVLAGFVTRFIEETPPWRPFFAVYAPTTPHPPADDDRYQRLQARLPSVPSFDEDTRASGKVRHLRRKAFTERDAAKIRREYGRMAGAVRSLDDSVEAILSALGPRAADTLVVYLSDNGYHYGEHRLKGKRSAYEESVRVPLAVRYPPAGRSFESRALVSNVDVAATIADLTGLEWEADGRSLVPLLEGRAPSVRTEALIEFCPAQPGTCLEGAGVPAFWGIVSDRYKYIEYLKDQDVLGLELYDLSKDPYELRNLAGDSRYFDVERRLAAQLATIRAAPATAVS